LTVFVDTSIWFAVANTRDRGNERAKAILATMVVALTTDHVLVETWLLLNSRVHRHAAEQFWRGIRSGISQIEKVTIGDLETAWAIGEVFLDQNFSIRSHELRRYGTPGNIACCELRRRLRHLSLRAKPRPCIRGIALSALG
jgi:predicted nucleic acid-binding protein